MSPPNLEAVIKLLNDKEIEHNVIENDSGWRVELESWIAGSDLNDLIKLADTQPNVVVAFLPGFGLLVQTGAFVESSTDEFIPQEKPK